MRLFKIFLVLTLSLSLHLCLAQNYSDNWQGYFSTLNITDIAQGEFKVFGAAENSIFIYDKKTKDIKELTTIHGLSGELISTIGYSEDKGILLIGFENGLIQVYNESTEEFIYVVDILEKPNILPTGKVINHFQIVNDKAYISAGFGISVYNLSRLEFGDTYFVGDNGAQTNASQITIIDNTIYVALATGIKKADINNPNLIDYNEWKTVVTGNWIGIQTVEDKIYAITIANEIHEILDNASELKLKYVSQFKDVKSISDSNLFAVATLKEVFLYDKDFNEITTLKNSEELTVNFSSVIFDNSNVYIGTTADIIAGNPGLGILKVDKNNSSNGIKEIHPTSPLSNAIFKITVFNNEIWETYGGYSSSYGWEGGVRKTGYSHFKDGKWNNTLYKDIETLIDKPWHLTSLAVNPFKPEDVYLSSYFSGVIYIKNGEIQQPIINKENSTIVPFAGDFYLINTSFFDKDGAYWVTNARINPSINRLKDGKWDGFSLESLIDPPGKNLGFSTITEDKEGNIFIASNNFGIIGLNPNNNKIASAFNASSNMPSVKVKAVAVDKKNTVWIGTAQGLRVIYSISEFFNNKDYQVSNIVILEEGVAKELLYQQNITDIIVDGSNNKWISTLSTGVFFLSEDGQQTIEHFTKDNSPLPTNDVLDLEFDETTGLVYMSTPKGLVVYDSGSSNAKKTLKDAFVYPNPVRPEFNVASEKIKIKDLSENVNIKITDISGNLVAEAQTKINQKYKGFNLEIDGGTAFWDGKNIAGTNVASGVYMVFISDLDSDETKTLKIMVVR